MMEDFTPLHRIADSEESAVGVVSLASPAGAFLTGKVLEIDVGTDIPSLAFALADLKCRATPSSARRDLRAPPSSRRVKSFGRLSQCASFRSCLLQLKLCVTLD